MIIGTWYKPTYSNRGGDLSARDGLPAKRGQLRVWLYDIRAGLGPAISSVVESVVCRLEPRLPGKLGP